MLMILDFFGIVMRMLVFVKRIPVAPTGNGRYRRFNGIFSIYLFNFCILVLLLSEGMLIACFM